MKKEKIKQLMDVMQAYVNGKTIQYYKVDLSFKIEHPGEPNSNNKWVDVDEEHLFRPDLYVYRVKPEPKYRPFKDADECWQEMLKHEPFGWVVIIENNLSIKYNIQALVQDGVKSTAVLTDDVMSEKFPFEGVLQKFTFVDGTPFGIKKEEV